MGSFLLYPSNVYTNYFTLSGRQALDFYGADQVAYFCDNNPALAGSEVSGKKVIDFAALEQIWRDYRVVVAVGVTASISVVQQLRAHGIVFSFFRDEEAEGKTGNKEIFSHIYAENLWGGGCNGTLAVDRIMRTLFVRISIC